jgi:hypothetical protein
MPPRFAYWTILAGGLPTSFRAADKDELMPTFRRLKEKHPDAEMKYFARGKLWDSAEEARRAFEAAGASGGRGERPHGGHQEQRGRDWRPGGEHRDPRQRFKDAKKARNQDWREQRWNRKNQGADGRPHAQGSRPGSPGGQHRPFDSGHGKPFGAAQRKPFDSARRKRFDPAQGKPFGAAQGKPPRHKPHGDKLRGEVPRRPFTPSTRRRFERDEQVPPRPPRPDREPPPGREPKPEPPPRPSEPAIKPPGPPERGQPSKGRGFRRKRGHEE